MGNIVGMEMTLGEIAELVGATLEGERGFVVRGVCALGETGPKAKDHLSFASADHGDALARSRVQALLVREVPTEPAGRQFVVAPDPSVAFAKVAGRFHPLPLAREHCVHPRAVVADDVELEEPVVIGPNAVIEGGVRVGRGSVIMAGAFVGARVHIGRDCLLYPNTTIYAECQLGNRVVVHSSSVIGADGFGNVHDGSGWLRVPQIGNVILEDDVEIGACTTIDRGTLDPTRVERGARIDNHVMVAHNSVIGAGTAIAAHVAIAGSTHIGKNCQIAGQVGMVGHVSVADGSVLGARTGVVSSLEQPGFYAGFPAQAAREEMKTIAGTRRIGELRRKVRELTRRLDEALGAAED